MVATLGGQPQVVTFTLDLLLQRGYPLTEVWVLWLPGAPRYRASLDRLREAFVGDVYRGRPLHLRALGLELRGRPLADLRYPDEIDAAWEQMDHLFARLKTAQYTLHLSLTGGRRMLSLLALSVAMRRFTLSDHAWHIYTPDDVRAAARNGRQLHVDTERLQLIAVPLMPLGAYFPAVRELLGRSPRALPPALDADDLGRCQRVWERLTTREREALRVLAQTATRSAAARQLGVAISTLDTHKNRILAHCRREWRDQPVDVHFLRRVFGPFLTQV